MTEYTGTNWRIIVGDCLDMLDALPDGCTRLVFADPPYNIGVNYGNGEKADRRPRGAFADWCREWIMAAGRKLTPDGSFWLLINHENAAHAFLSMEAAGLQWRNTITWVETFGVNCEWKFNRTSRPLLYFSRRPTRIVFHAEAVSRPSDRVAKYNDPRGHEAARKRREAGKPEGKLMDDVWRDIPRLCGTHKERIKARRPDGSLLFPTQLPLALLRRIIAVASNPGDLVLDPFTGSATAGVAAVESRRRFLGVELDPLAAVHAAERLRRVEAAGA